jgi:transaldolase / glucose-6-phosphate isomerase
LCGTVAIATAKLAYQTYRNLFASDRFRRLSARGATPQRLLWGSVGTKTLGYSDVMYLDALVGPETVVVVPLEVLHAYRDHGMPTIRLTERVWEAEDILRRESQLGINLNEVTQQLRDESIDRFFEPFDRLITVLGKKQSGAGEKSLGRQTLALGGYESAVGRRIQALEETRFTSRLWRKDPSL